ncbi:MAG: rod shape-determining protein RodA [Candidatus Moranbacteria bacterium]|nr:rod shape-determining protein RodA [Candidatus Moranbacteria bacterium]
MKFSFANFLKIDWILFFAVAFLTASGLLAIYSLSISSSEEGANNFQKQLIYLSVGLVFFLFFYLVDHRVWKNYSKFFYISGLALLALVLVFGITVRGTSGWFDLGVANFQPVELVKIFLIIYLADYLSRKRNKKLGFKELGFSFFIMLLPVVLVLRQPDFGSASILVVIWLFMVFFAGANKKLVISLIAVGLIGFIAGWNIFLQDYQKDRIHAFLNPQNDPLGSGYNVIQSMVAIGSGGLTGKGIGYGSQSQLNFLPEKHTDFVFAAIAEESGFLGTSLVLFFFWVLLFKMNKIALNSKDYFGKLLVMGIFGMLFFQIVINVGMNLGIIPVAGISLPFLSYGGSFLIVTFIALGLVMSVYKRGKKGNFAPDEIME